MSCALRQHKIRKILENPLVLQGSVDDAQELSRQRDNGPAGTTSDFHPFVETLQVRAVVRSHERRLHQRRTSQLAAPLMNPAAALGSVGIGDPRDDAEVTGQPML